MCVYMKLFFVLGQSDIVFKLELALVVILWAWESLVMVCHNLNLWVHNRYLHEYLTLVMHIYDWVLFSTILDILFELFNFRFTLGQEKY